MTPTALRMVPTTVRRVRRLEDLGLSKPPGEILPLSSGKAKAVSRVRRLPANADAPSFARGFVRSELGGCEEKVLLAAELMVSELVSNAVVHGSGPIQLEFLRAEDIVKATVTDRGAGRPELQDPRKDEPHGRGILIVQSLALDWGVEDCEVGKSVWFTLRCSGTL